MASTVAQRKKWSPERLSAYRIRRARERRNRKAAVRKITRDYKLAHPCVCGEKDPDCLQFHHRPGEKKRLMLSNLQGLGPEATLAEIKTCELICANDHARGHAGRPREEHKNYFSSV
jgi:hypothetical protein